MPYIAQGVRKDLKPKLSKLLRFAPNLSEGEINYIITKLLLARLGKKPCYADYNASIGVLECAKLELYRRAVAEYEDVKCDQNGDVYGEKP